MSLRRSTRVATRPMTSTTTVAAPIDQEAGASRKRAAGKGELPVTSKKPRRSASASKARSSPTAGKSNDARAVEEVNFKKPDAPVTPLKKGRTVKKGSGKAPPLTPSPSSVKVLTASYNPGDIDSVKLSLADGDRPVEPHITNAPLVTPGGTKTLAYVGVAENASPSKTGGLPRPTATTGTVLNKACAHLVSVDARMIPLIAKHRCPIFTPEGLAEAVDPFESLSSGIISQQVSGAAATSIRNKFIALFSNDLTGEAARNGGAADSPKFPTTAQVAGTSIERLRTAGLSQRKAEYIQGLAQKFVDGELTNAMLMKASDDEVMEKLIAVRGLGKWSVEMFACFGLKRLDILSTGDLGVQRGMAHFFGKDVQKLKAKGGGKWKYMSEQDMLEKSAPFAPYRSLFMWYMWQVADVGVDAMQSAS